MGLAGGCQCRPCRVTTTFTPFPDPGSLHVGDLCKDGQDQLTSAPTDLPKAVHLNRDAVQQQVTDSTLDVQGIAPQPVHGVDTQDVAFTNILEQFRKAGTVSGERRPADTLIAELPVEVVAEGSSLAFN